MLCAWRSGRAAAACALPSGAAATRLPGETRPGSAVPPTLRGRHLPGAARHPALTPLGHLPRSRAFLFAGPLPPGPPRRYSCPPGAPARARAAPAALSPAGPSSGLTSTPPAEALGRGRRMRSRRTPRSPSPPGRTEMRLRTTRFAHAQKGLRAGREQGSVLWASQGSCTHAPAQRLRCALCARSVPGAREAGGHCACSAAGTAPVRPALSSLRMLSAAPANAGGRCAPARRPESGRGRRRAEAGQPVMASVAELGGAGP